MVYRGVGQQTDEVTTKEELIIGRLSIFYRNSTPREFEGLAGWLAQFNRKAGR